MMALAAERYPLDPMIASHIHWTLASQMPDGSWLGNGVNRPPAESSTVSHTAIAARGLTLYPIPARRPDHAVYRRGVQFLLATQHADGSWLVRTRAFPVQPYFESGFPFDRHQLDFRGGHRVGRQGDCLDASERPSITGAC